MGRDQMSYAYIRNRAENSHLQSELQRIEREQQDEMRILNTERRRFRTKYAKASSSTRPAVPITGPIFETHEPGSRHRRKLDAQQVDELDSPTHLDEIREMVFTDGAVDIEKIACLHLVSAYRSETLSPPKRKALACKEHSPTERLIDRSKKGYLNNEKVSDILPLYTVEPIEQGAMGEHSSTVIRDGRLAARILINKTTRVLIGTVVAALGISNTDKLARLSNLANDPDLLKKIFEKKHIQDFVTFLSDLPLINHCDAFVLTPPFKIKSRDLNIKTNTGALEALVKNIRQTVLQLPTRKLIMTSIEEKKPVRTISEPKRCLVLSSARQWKSENTMKHPKQTSDESEADRILNRKTGKRYGRHSNINFINRNIKGASKVRRIEYVNDDIEEVYKPKNSLRSSVFKLKNRRTASPQSSISEDSTIIDNAAKEEVLLEVVSPKISTASCDSKPTKDKPENAKYHIKRTTCPACMEKWKHPLPSPKTPRVRKSNVLPATAENQLLKTDSIHRIDVLINKEMYALESYDRRYSSMNSSLRRSTAVEKNVTIANPFALVDLSPIDLARIEQEIKQKETQSKLEMFLSEHVI